MSRGWQNVSAGSACLLNRLNGYRLPSEAGWGSGSVSPGTRGIREIGIEPPHIALVDQRIGDV